MKIPAKILLSALAASVAGAASAYAAAGDFSIANGNPNGVWSYGYAPTLTGAMVLDTQTATGGPLEAWQGAIASDGNPSVVKNTSGSSYTPGTNTWLPYQMIQHPGPNGEVSIVRFTAPAAGSYALLASFIGQDGTSTDVHVFKNGASIFDGAINGYGNATGYASIVLLGMGDTLDLRVGFGSNGTFYNDSTGTGLSVQAVPEPASMAGPRPRRPRPAPPSQALKLRRRDWPRASPDASSEGRPRPCRGGFEERRGRSGRAPGSGRTTP